MKAGLLWVRDPHSRHTPDIIVLSRGGLRPYRLLVVVVDWWVAVSEAQSVVKTLPALTGTPRYQVHPAFALPYSGQSQAHPSLEGIGTP